MGAMKLLYIENTLAIHGGIERVLTDKLNWLVEHGDCEICLLLANQGNHPIVFPLSHRVECHDLGIMFHQVYRYSGLKRYRLMFKLHRLFRQRVIAQIQTFSPDIIVFTRMGFVCDIMKVHGNVPVVYEAHNTFSSYTIERRSWLLKLQLKYWHYALRKVQVIVALTQGDAMEWKKLNPHVQVIPNVVHLNETSRFSDCCSKSAIFVGRFSFQKDIQSLLLIWREVYQRHPDWQLHIFGGYGEQQDNCVTVISKMEAGVSLHQPTAQIYNNYLKSSILLMTSYYESFGLVLPEAMSCGLPVVAFDCPYGPADIISDGEDGFIIKNRSINEYVDKVCLLMEDENLRKKLGRAGILSSQRYRASVIMPQWLHLFNEISQKSK